MAFSNYLFRVIEISGSNGISERLHKHFTYPTLSTMGSKIRMFRVVDIDVSSCREALKNRLCPIGRDREWSNIVIKRQQRVTSILCPPV